MIDDGTLTAEARVVSLDGRRFQFAGPLEPGFEPDPRARPEPIRMGRHNPLPKGGPRPGGPRRAGTGRAPAHPGQGRRSPR